MNKFLKIIIFSRLARYRSVNNFVKNKYTYKNDVNKFLILISIPFFNKNNKNTEDSVNKILQNVDNLYKAEKYNEAYDILTEHKDDQNVEILWRISRILYQKMQKENSKATEHITEAYEVIGKALDMDAGCSKAHTWMAVILSNKARREGFLSSVRAVHVVRYHLEKAVELDSTDIFSLYMLGTWHAQISNLNWFQRGIINYFSSKTIKTNFEQALVYFEKIEKIEPRKHIANVYMLGKLNLELKRFYFAIYYLKIASGMDPQDEAELKYVHLARALANRLRKSGFLLHYPLTD